jgi:hypothetical protein
VRGYHHRQCTGSYLEYASNVLRLAVAFTHISAILAYSLLLNTMVTGIETAGLALAAFPILVQGLDFYNSGIRRTTELKNYRRVLKRLVRELKMERCKFGNTCENLLDGMPSISAEETKMLIEGRGWGDAKFQDKLEKHLGPRSAAAFIEAVEVMHLCRD